MNRVNRYEWVNECIWADSRTKHFGSVGDSRRFKTCYRVCLLIIILLLLSACVSTQPIYFEGQGKKYQCLRPATKTILTMAWDTCPLVGMSPMPVNVFARWQLQPVTSKVLNHFVQAQQQLQGKLASKQTNCSWPTRIDKIVVLDSRQKINLDYMNEFNDERGSGIAFDGSTVINNKSYALSYKAYYKNSPSSIVEPIEKHLEKYFRFCR